MKVTPRTRKVNEAVKEALAEILVDEISDPRLDLVTVTSVEVSGDLRLANVYVTTHGDAERYEEMLQGLNSAKGRIRSSLGRRVRMQFVPELTFKLDRSIDEGMRISQVLRENPPTSNAEEAAGGDDRASSDDAGEDEE